MSNEWAMAHPEMWFVLVILFFAFFSCNVYMVCNVLKTRAKERATRSLISLSNQDLEKSQ